ncbi:MAG: patatin-like phospholipase family protein [Bacteroidia bacterium]|nr:patatin-like phospholipase family protein [Bacteroidia bacterium]
MGKPSNNIDTPTSKQHLKDLQSFFEGENELIKFAKDSFGGAAGDHQLQISDQDDLDFLQEVKEAVESVNNYALGQETRRITDVYPPSDIFFEENGQKHWFVDLVQEGGGVLGVALVGYVYVLEKAGIRFMKLAGTSAGAINTLLMAALDDPEKAKTEKILPKLNSLNLAELQDGSKRLQKRVDWLLNLSKTKGLMAKSIIGAALYLAIWLTLVFLAKGVFWLQFALAIILIPLPMGIATILAWPIFKTLKKNYGLYEGKFFEKWVSNSLKEEGVENTLELEKRMKRFENPIYYRPQAGKVERFNPNATGSANNYPIAMVASDVTCKMKAVFPEDAHLYFGENWKEKVNPAEFVRASMSIPLFFYPKALDPLPNNDLDKINWIERLRPDTTIMERTRRLRSIYNPNQQRNVQDSNLDPDKEWFEKQKQILNIPSKSLMVDGGVISNFPIDIFHVHNRLPKRPTLGAKLGVDHRQEKGADENQDLGPLGILATAFDTARLARDMDFIKSNPDFSQLVKAIPTDGHDWLNFKISKDDKRDLFAKGAKAAAEFLLKFNWKQYKELRRTSINQATNSFNTEEIIEELDFAQMNKYVNFLKRKTDIESQGLQEKVNQLLQRFQFVKFNRLQDRKEKIDKDSQGIIDALGLEENLQVRKILHKDLSRSGEFLKTRINKLDQNDCSFKILWVSDSMENDDIELELVREIQINKHNGITVVRNSEEAENELEKQSYDIMISDIFRGGNKSEGVDFLKKIHQKHAGKALPQTIFYITNFNPEKGVPEHAFGITNNPVELIHLVVDTIELRLANELAREMKPE